MENSLKEGMSFEFKYKVPEDKTVPFLFPEFQEGKVMPKVFASGFLVGLFEFACIQFIDPHIDWPNEQTVGVGFNIKHTAATPSGFTITVKGVLEEIKGQRLKFSISADDGIDKISEGTHDRFIINAKGFNEQVEKKAGKLS